MYYKLWIITRIKRKMYERDDIIINKKGLKSGVDEEID